MSIRSSLVALTIPMAVACGAATPAAEAPEAPDTAAVEEVVTEESAEAVVEEAAPAAEEAAPAAEEAAPAAEEAPAEAAPAPEAK
jgi:hypothetical protein